MLLTVHNLPTHMRYADVKSLILSKCGLKEVILDNLVSDGRNSKRVTVGLAEEEDAALLVRHINGLYLEGRQLYVEDVRKKKSSDQPFRQSHNNYESSNTDTDRSNKQQSNYAPQVNYAQQVDYQQSQYPSQTAGWQADNFGNQQVVNPEQVMPLMMPYMGGMNMGGMYYMPQGQNSYMDYSSQQPQLTSTADQYSQFPYQQGQTGSGLGSQTVKEDNWSRKRRDGMCSSPGDNDNNHGTQSTYKSDPRQVSGGWARGRDMEPSRRRSRSPRNKRERSRGRSGISPKRARNEDNSRDFSRKDANFNRDSQRYPSNRDDSYTSQAYGNSYNASQNYANSNNTSQNYGNSNNTSQAYGNSNTPSQTYGNINQNRPYYNNEPVTATSSNNRPQPLLSLPTQNPWNSGTDHDNDYPKFQEQKSGGLSNSAASFQKKSHVPVWDRDNTSSLDNQSNYRKHMEMKASQDQSKSSWRNPMQSSWDRVVDSYEGDSRSQYSWTNKGQDKNDTKSSSWGGQSSAPGEIKPLMEKKPLLSSPPKSWERSFDKHKPMKYEPKVHTNVPKKWPTKPKKNRGKGKTSVMPIIRQDSTSRFKAAGQIATEIAKAHPDIIKPEHVKNLRQSVRSRFEILLAERLGESLPQMIAIYRAKFPASQDREFCRLVVEQAPAESKTTVVDLTGPDVKTEIKREKPNPQVAKNQPPSARNQPTVAKNQPPVQKNQQKDRDYIPPWERKGKNQPGNSQQNKSKQPKLPRLQLPNPTDKLPKYPNSDKQVYKEQKKLKKLEHQNEDLYSLTPHLQQALDEELKNITDIFKSVASNADTEQEKGLCERFLSIGLEQVRKVVKLNVTKRLLNITTNLIIRVFVQGKPSKKQEVELFLRKHKIVSLKKSDKRKIVYIATCKDFNTYDRMLEMGSAPLNNETVLRFKPFQLVGPKLSFRERNEQRLQRLRGLEGSNTENATENFEDSADAKDEIIDISEELNEEEIKNEPKIEDVVENSTEPEEEVTENSTGPDVEEIMDNLEEEHQEQDDQNDDNDIIENVDDIDDVDEDDLEDY
ncbi:hypothetical protein ABMA27_010252 [Loxostege sticticalis]|uniref:RRM domain-containing protein n=1 Tax=Loxostege sticticalis TaxID=481309 RepID=A0ABR3H553_LOXSC